MALESFMAHIPYWDLVGYGIWLHIGTIIGYGIWPQVEVHFVLRDSEALPQDVSASGSIDR